MWVFGYSDSMTPVNDPVAVFTQVLLLVALSRTDEHVHIKLAIAKISHTSTIL
jgi:hypothetical protein